MKNIIVTAALAVASLTASAAQASLLTDGSFEIATGGSTTSNSPWILAANKPNNVDVATQFQTAPWSSSDGNTGVWYKSFTGLGNGSNLTGTSILTQSVVAPQTGGYILTFDAAREANFLADEWYVAIVSNTSGGGLQDTVDLLTAPMPPGNFGSVATQFSLALSGVDAGDTLSVFAVMTGGRNSNVNPQSAFLDNFDLNFVPEPASMALVLLSAVGIALIRRR
ncbi:MAG: PEP-CTERM sorting domain-containing protein [Planctomycetales bacterium]|nr:PEP-CTERM sorting domain-containing protein [Planctomycetales bacterium]